MEKTLREWFEMFPEPYRTQAIENTLNLRGEGRFIVTKTNAMSAIVGAFVWEDSPQKDKYWNEFHDQLHRNEIVLTEPSEGGKQ
jgi:hypothetical protein